MITNNRLLSVNVRMALVAVVIGAATPAVAEEVQSNQGRNEVLVTGDGMVLTPVDLSAHLALAGASVGYFRAIHENYGVQVRAGFAYGANEEIDVGLVHAEVGLGMTVRASDRARLRIIPAVGAAFALAQGDGLIGGAAWITAGAEVEGTYWLGRNVGLTASLTERVLVAPGDLSDSGLMHSAALGATLRF